MSERMSVISPEGLQLREVSGVSRHLDTLAGKTIGEVYNNHFKGEQMFGIYRRLLRERFPGVRIIPFDQFPTVYVGGDPASQKKTAKEIAALAKEWEVDAIITGNGGGGTRTPSSGRPAAEAEKPRIPRGGGPPTGVTNIAKATGQADGINPLTGA